MSLLFCITTATAQNKKTVKQIEQIETAKKRRTIIQRKIDSRLLQAIGEYQSKKTPATPPTEKVNVNADSSGHLAVDIKAIVSDSLLQRLQALGGKIIHASKEYSSIRATVHLLQVETIAAWREVSFIQPAVQAMNNSMPVPGD